MLQLPTILSNTATGADNTPEKRTEAIRNLLHEQVDMVCDRVYQDHCDLMKALIDYDLPFVLMGEVCLKIERGKITNDKACES